MCMIVVVFLLLNNIIAAIIHKIIAMKFIVIKPVTAAAISKAPAKFLRPLIVKAPNIPNIVENAKIN